MRNLIILILILIIVLAIIYLFNFKLLSNQNNYIIDNDGDFDDLISLLWSLININNTSYTWRTVGSGYSYPLNVKIGNNSLGVWAKNKLNLDQKIIFGNDKPYSKSLYSTPYHKILEFTKKLSEYLAENQKHKINSDTHKNYTINNSREIIILGPLTNIAIMDSPLWNKFNCPNIIISGSSHIKNFPLLIGETSNIGLDPMASLKVFKKLSELEKIPIIIYQQIPFFMLLNLLNKLIKNNLIKCQKKLLIAKKIYSILLFTLDNNGLGKHKFVWDLTALIISQFPNLIKNKILCHIYFDKKQLICIPISEYKSKKPPLLVFIVNEIYINKIIDKITMILTK
jgi:inosine-uridine nucleoside N-ribohydrolase